MDFEEEDDAVRSIFEVLLETESIVIMGYDHQGEPVYRFTEKCKDTFPELYEMHLSEVNKTANELWQMGIISLNFTDDDMTISIDQSNYRNLREQAHRLTDEQADFLEALAIRKNLDED